MGAGLMTTELDDIQSILPKRQLPLSLDNPDRDSMTENALTAASITHDAKSLAKLKLAARTKKANIDKALAADPDSPRTPAREQAQAETEQTLSDLSVLETEVYDSTDPLDIKTIAKNAKRRAALTGDDSSLIPQQVVRSALQLQGTSRPEISRLLRSLNINLSVRLSRDDTLNLLACILTCNEAQLRALYQNAKIPLAIKTIIKRLQDDSKIGSIDTVERLWDRVFGKGPAKLDLVDPTQSQSGLIPNTPISREAYIVIRDTLLR